MSSPSDQRMRAALLAIFAVGAASIQDAIVKSVSGIYPVTETVMIRGLTSLPILAILLMRAGGFKSLSTPHWRLILLRSLILCSAYFAFVMAFAAMPLATAVSIYFTMPFFVAGLSGPFLHERVPLYRWIAIALGFLGVIIMVRPGASSFEPAALFALYSAVGYAVGQMLGRKVAQKVAPIVIANWQNTIYLLAAVILALAFHFTGPHEVTHKSLTFLTRPLIWPSLHDLIVLGSLGALAALVMVAFIEAYRAAPANFVAPFEYSAMIWAVGLGFWLFGDLPDRWTLIGMAVVVGAGLFMLFMDARRHHTG
jgi:drug/metabolite transporter (DMT)-like permease